MDTLLVLMIVLLAAGFLGRRALHSWKAARSSASGCASGCGCGTTSGEPKSWDQTPRV